MHPSAEALTPGAAMFEFRGLPYARLRCAFAVGAALLFCVLLPSAYAQKLPAADDDSKLTNEERLQRAHSVTAEKFKA
jgi:hypothetical protein